MSSREMKSEPRQSKTIGLVAHDNRKRDLIEWVEWNSEILMGHRLVCTGTTGRLVEEGLKARLALSKDPTPVRRAKGEDRVIASSSRRPPS